MSCVELHARRCPPDIDRASAEYRDFLQDFLNEARPYFVAHHYLHENRESQQWRADGLYQCAGQHGLHGRPGEIRQQIAGAAR